MSQELKCLGTFVITMSLFLFIEMIHCLSAENWENKQKEKRSNLPPSHHSEMITANILEHVLPLFLIWIILEWGYTVFNFIFLFNILWIHFHTYNVDFGSKLYSVYWTYHNSFILYRWAFICSQYFAIINDVAENILAHKSLYTSEIISLE